MNQDKEQALTLELLEAIEEREDLTQRHLARRLGVALGLANSYLKRCVRKGLVKIQQAPANRYLYYLTPKGFAEKSRLTARYLSYSFEFYRRAGDDYLRVYADCVERGQMTTLLCGLSELAEIASLKAVEAGVEIAGFYDARAIEDRFLRQPVWRSLDDAHEAAAYVVTDLVDPLEMFAQLKRWTSADRIHVPEVLGLIHGGRGEKRFRAG